MCPVQLFIAFLNTDLPRVVLLALLQPKEVLIVRLEVGHPLVLYLLVNWVIYLTGHANSTLEDCAFH